MVLSVTAQHLQANECLDKMESTIAKGKEQRKRERQCKTSAADQHFVEPPLCQHQDAVSSIPGAFWGLSLAAL
jgi:hypothetical protein